jgi:hypothetical protein
VLGLNHNFPTALLHAPRTPLGLDIPDFYVSQGIEHVHMLLSVGRLSNNLTGSLLRGYIEQHKLELEVGCGSLFHHGLHRINSIVTPSWFKSTWSFLQEYDLCLNEGMPNLQLRLQHDSFLTAHFV